MHDEAKIVIDIKGLRNGVLDLDAGLVLWHNGARSTYSESAVAINGWVVVERELKADKQQSMPVPNLARISAFRDYSDTSLKFTMTDGSEHLAKLCKGMTMNEVSIALKKLANSMSHNKAKEVRRG